MLTTLWFLIKLGFGLLIAYSFLHSFVTHFIVWFELRLRLLAGEVQGPIPLLYLLKSFFIESFCVFIRFFLYPLVLFTSQLKPRIYTENVPILLIHGYMQAKSEWVWFKQKLERAPEIGPVYALNLSSRFSSIAQLSENLKLTIQTIKQETQQDKIILIGHSMGGLICSYYGEYLAETGEISKIITLGTPFRGTRMAALGFGENVKEMSPNSFFLKQLTQRMQHSSISYHCVASMIDNLIVPWQAAFPAHNNLPSANKLVLEDHGHLRLLISPQVVQQVIQWIQKSV
jgi:triacylglycerol lipase